MKLKGTSLFLGLCVAILAVAASPAFARSTTAFSSFHVERQYPNQYANPENSLSESYGAMVNNCSYPSAWNSTCPSTLRREKKSSMCRMDGSEPIQRKPSTATRTP